ncbi:hypothetical protein [Streptomyces sp. CB02130]|uniref:AbiJ-related protein n=1 Tax=Streptomyces sp. CB02130 TaxID=1703934 RepID=UPI001F5280FF|nr:hypothetical protein [Streptomyces sp. CB02130]
MTQFVALSAPHSTQRITSLTRREAFEYLNGDGRPWWGRLNEVVFLQSLYDLDALSSANSRFRTAREEITQHRIRNESDWPDDWVFSYPNFRISDGADDEFLAFLARFVHPETQPDGDHSSRHVEQLNRILGPDGWALRPFEYLSGRPIYTPAAVQATEPLVALPLGDDDAGKLDLVLGQTYGLLDREGENAARDLVRMSVLTLRRDGGFFHPMAGNSWTDDTYEAVLTVPSVLLPSFTATITDTIWARLQTVLTRLQRADVQSLVVDGDPGPLPSVSEDWRDQEAEHDAPISRRLRILLPTTEFNVTEQTFSDLEIRGEEFPYFYDTRKARLVTDFLLDDRPRVATLCQVTLINKDGVLSPRVKLWKKDRLKPRRLRCWRPFLEPRLLM